MPIVRHLPRTFLAAVSAGLLWAGGSATAEAAPDSSDLLLQLLVKKGIVTPEEAADLRNQVQAQAQAQAAPPPAPAPSAPAPTAAEVSGPLPTPERVANVEARPVSGPITNNELVTHAPGTSPLYFSIGKTHFSPLGFMDFTTVYRTALNGGDIGSSFGSIPYGNTANSQLSETRFSAKNSRIGLRVDSNVGSAKVLGYLETDFLGNAATNINVASNSDVMRMRVYFVDVAAGQWEFLAGQDWSMLTPNRKGLSPLPSDIFYSQDMDTNYQVGLVWERTPQFRIIYHPSDEWAMGFAAENPDQYVGSAVTLPSNLTSTFVDNGSNGTATPNPMPDIVGKIAFDTRFGDLPFHAEAVGVFRDYKIDTYGGGINASSTATGEGGGVNLLFNVAPAFTLIGTSYIDDGSGRQISTGVAPDFIVNGPNSAGVDTITPVHSDAFIGGFEWDTTPMFKLYGYYGRVDIGRAYDQTGPTSYVGYGYAGSSNADNKDIEEYTIGAIPVLWKNPAYGDLKLIFQYSYLDRAPWFIAAGTPSSAHDNMFFADLRYDLP